MRRQIFGWSFACAITTALAVTLLVSAAKAPAPAALQAAPPKRDPAKVSDVEIELILNKIREGDLRALNKEMDAARRAWQEARKMGEGLWPVHEGLGDSYARARLYDDAVREYLAAETLVPEKLLPARLSIAFKRGETLSAAGKNLEAIQAYLELNQPGPLGGKILDLALKADRDEAVKRVAQRAELDPRVFALLAALFTKLDRKADAAEATAKFAIALAPWDENLNRQAIEGLRAARKYDLAVEVCRAWARSSPQALQAYQLMGDLYLEAGREREAFIAYTSIVDVRAGDAAAHRMLGDILRKLNRIDDAIAQYEHARKARPEDEITYATLVPLYESKGDAARVEALLHDAAKRFGESSQLRARLVASYQDQISRLRAAGKTEEARALRRKLGEMNVPEAGLFDIKIIMTWDVESDVDMDVIQPDGEHLHHGHPRSKAGGVYYVDNTRAFGPETYTLKEAAPGTYRVGAHLHSGQRSAVKFVVILFEDTPREERREEDFVLEKSGEQKFIRDIVIPKP